jgi:uncharacterized cupin superfamily protein
MPKIDISATPLIEGTGYPPVYAGVVSGRAKRRIGDAAGLSQYGVNITRLKPGAASAHRHWHKNEDEFVYVISGELLLIEDTGETLLRAGDAAGFPAGAANGHQLVNRSGADALFLEVGTRARTEEVAYTDPQIDMKGVNDGTGWKFLHRDGRPW